MKYFKAKTDSRRVPQKGKEREMNADEIVGALRICNRTKGHRCSECPIFSRYEHRTCKATVDKAAADLIESLQAQLAAQAQGEGGNCEDVDYESDHKDGIVY